MDNSKGWILTTLAFILHKLGENNFKQSRYRIAALLLLTGEIINVQDDDDAPIILKDYDYITDVISFIGFIWIVIFSNLKFKTKFWLTCLLIGLTVRSKIKVNTYIIYCTVLSSFIYNLEHINNKW